MRTALGIGTLTAALTVASVSSALFTHYAAPGDGDADVTDPTPDPTYLAGFSLQYAMNVLQYWEDDKEVKRLGVLTDLAVEDRTYLSLYDGGHNDTSWMWSSHEVISQPGVQMGVTSGSSTNCVSLGLCLVTLTRPSLTHVFVLRGFRLEYEGSDQHVERVMVQEQNGVLSVALNDADNNNAFRYRVEYAWVPRTQAASTGTFTRQTTGSFSTTSIPNNAVLSGFDFDFDKGQHELQALRALRSESGSWWIGFHDRNSDDPYHVKIKWTVMGAPGVFFSTSDATAISR